MAEINRPNFPGFEQVRVGEENTNLHFTRKRNLPKTYLDDRDKAWNAFFTGDDVKRIWNGSIYTIEGVSTDGNQLNLEIGLCEYKDVLFKQQIGYEMIIKHYGNEVLPYHVIVACLPITDDGKLVIGIRQDSEAGEILDLIGGTLNADEMTVSGFADVRLFMAREFTEEVEYEVNPDQLELFCVNQYGGKYEFIYLYRLGESSYQLNLTPKDEEFSRLVLLTPEELLNSAVPKDDTLVQMEKYIRDFE